VEEEQRREVKPSVRERAEQQRKASRELRDARPTVGFARAHAELVAAELEHARRRALEMDPPVLDLAEVSEDRGLDAMSVGDEPTKTGEELLVGQCCEVHAKG
jgi:hypothetical protein